MAKVEYIGGIPHTPDIVAENLLGTLGSGNKCLGKWHFTFTKEELLPWLQTLVQDDLELLTEALVFFGIQMEPIAPLIDKGLKKSYTPQEIIAAHAWSKYATITIFSIVEGLISRRSGVTQMRFMDFIKGKVAGFKTVPTPKELDVLAGEHQRLYPGSRARVKIFYTTNLSAGTIAGIVSSYRSWEVTKKKTFKDIDDVLDDLYGPIRSGFVHEMGREALQIEPIVGNLVPEAEGGGIKFYDNLTPQEFICMTWRAILNSFGYTTNTTFTN